MMVSSEAFTLSLCPAVWLLMALLAVCIYRMPRRSLLKWVALLLLNVALWCVWLTQYRLIAANPPWATSRFRFLLLLIESISSAVVLFSMMVQERARIRSRNLARLEWDG